MELGTIYLKDLPNLIFTNYLLFNRCNCLLYCNKTTVNNMLRYWQFREHLTISTRNIDIWIRMSGGYIMNHVKNALNSSFNLKIKRDNTRQCSLIGIDYNCLKFPTYLNRIERNWKKEIGSIYECAIRSHWRPFCFCLSVIQTVFKSNVKTLKLIFHISW